MFKSLSFSEIMSAPGHDTSTSPIVLTNDCAVQLQYFEICNVFYLFLPCILLAD